MKLLQKNSLKSPSSLTLDMSCLGSNHTLLILVMSVVDSKLDPTAPIIFQSFSNML